MSKIYFLYSHQDYFPPNLRAEEQKEQVHQNLIIMENEVSGLLERRLVLMVDIRVNNSEY